MRPSDRVHQGRGLPVDSEMTIQRGEDVLIMNRPGGHFSGVAISAADDLASVETAAGHDAHRNLRPVLASAIVADFRRASKFSPHDNHHIVEHSALFQISVERVQRVIQQWPEVTDSREICFVRIKVTERKAHAVITENCL